MGRIQQRVILENSTDKWSEAQVVRRIEIDMRVDSGAAMPCLPKSAIIKLGLPYKKTVKAITADGLRERRIYAAANITIGNRDGTFDVMEVPDGVPPLLGYIPLEQMDYVIDFVRHKLIENPEHNGELTLDLL